MKIQIQKKTPLPLAEQLLDIVPQVMNQIRFEYRKNRSSELTITHFRLLANVWKAPKTNKDLAEVIGLSIPAMSRCVQTLEKRGLLKKTPRLNDRRECEIALTTKGLKLFESIQIKVIESVSNCMANLADSDKEHLANGLNVLQKILHL